ncbi:MAG: Re/Si-specific NAD(P)(+) transhydrogenase subunit alpha [Leptolyngbyaceae cyanobacterium]
MRVGIPKEITQGEKRVAATPDTAQKLQKLGFEVWIESGAGMAASFPDRAYTAAGCHVVHDVVMLWAESDIILKVQAPHWHTGINQHEAELLRPGGKLISFIWPAQNPELLEQLSQKGATAMAMDAVPRITRAQKLDALSSMANLAGYRAVIEAANQFSRGFTGQITAAGKIPPCKVLVIGAGVAGLAAIGTARGLGAIVRAFDTRPVVKEQVESLGAEFLELHFEDDENGEGGGGYAKVMSPAFIAAEMALFLEQAKEVDIIITTALIPGKPAPRLITQEMVEAMKPGSVIVDMAAEQGGNCELTRPHEIYDHNGVKVVGLTDLASRMANQASQLYGTNLYHLLNELGGAEEHHFDLEDDVVRQATVVHEGNVIWPAPPLERPAPPAPTPKVVVETDAAPKKANPLKQLIWPILISAALVGVGIAAPESFISHFTVFVLAIFLGWKVIWDVTPALHTPLMSVTNAISGIIIIGGMLQISGPLTSTVTILGAIAIFVSTLNISGGFFVTQRMLNMFRK